MKLQLNDSFTKKLPADPDTTNIPREVTQSCFSYVTPKQPSKPQLVHVSNAVAELLGFTTEDLASKAFLETVTGAKPIANSKPYAMCYGGHQFGHWAGQLGDGRAINLAEIEHNNQRWSIQLKGAGETPYSRTADGLAVLRSSVREHLCSEAMYHLGVPTTRSLSLSLSGDQVLRDVLYNGDSAYEKGAIVCRVAPSFIRFGNFDIFASRHDHNTLKRLVDYTISEFYPTITAGTQEGYLAFFKEVLQNTMDMVLHWQRVGFVHGVMNTDNMSILGLTIDYGPYGWLEGYEADWTPNTTDKQHKRYRFGNQPKIALWNLLQLANALFPLVGEAKPLEDILSSFDADFDVKYLNMMREKLGLQEIVDTDKQLIIRLEETLQVTETDMTLFFRKLANVPKALSIGEDASFLDTVYDAFYQPKELTDELIIAWKEWFKAYLERLAKEDLDDADRKKAMNKVNPKYVLRNYMAQLAIDKADQGDYSILEELHTVLKRPYDEQETYAHWFVKRPEWARHKVGCSMLSCSS